MKVCVIQRSRVLREPSPLAPELKDFVDRAIVPILVRKYLELGAHEKQIAGSAEKVALCDSMGGSPEAEAVE